MIISYFILAICIIFISGCGGNTHFYPQALMIVNEIDKVLIKNGICYKNIHCDQAFFNYPITSPGLEIYVYGITDKATETDIIHAITPIIFQYKINSTIKIFSERKNPNRMFQKEIIKVTNQFN